MAASVLTSTSTSTNATELPNELIEIIISKMHYPIIYKFHLEGNTVLTCHLLKEGKRIITLLENIIHSDAGYSPIGDDFDFTNLDVITKQIWNMLICVSPNADSDMHQQLLYNACAFITMECDVPHSYDGMCSDIWEFIIVRYLDSEYAETTNGWIRGYKEWKYISRAIEEYSVIYGLNTLAKQKYGISILITTYLKYKDTIMNMYEDEYARIDTNEKYYGELKSLIATVSGNAHLGVSMVCSRFVKDTFYFMSE